MLPILVVAVISAQTAAFVAQIPLWFVPLGFWLGVVIGGGGSLPPPPPSFPPRGGVCFGSLGGLTPGELGWFPPSSPPGIWRWASRGRATAFGGLSAQGSVSRAGPVLPGVLRTLARPGTCHGGGATSVCPKAIIHGSGSPWISRQLRYVGLMGRFTGLPPRAGRGRKFGGVSTGLALRYLTSHLPTKPPSSCVEGGFPSRYLTSRGLKQKPSKFFY